MAAEYFDDSKDRVDAFNNRVSGESRGVIIVPTAYLLPEEGKEGNAKHLIHDLLGAICRPRPEQKIFGKKTVVAQIPPSQAEEFRRISEEGTYISKAAIQWTSEDPEIIKS
jgi:hypothetical protein